MKSVQLSGQLTASVGGSCEVQSQCPPPEAGRPRRIATGDLVVLEQVAGAAVVGEAAAEPRFRRGTADGARRN